MVGVTRNHNFVYFMFHGDRKCHAYYKCLHLVTWPMIFASDTLILDYSPKINKNINVFISKHDFGKGYIINYKQIKNCFCFSIYSSFNLSIYVVHNISKTLGCNGLYDLITYFVKMSVYFSNSIISTPICKHWITYIFFLYLAITI